MALRLGRPSALCLKARIGTTRRLAGDDAGLALVPPARAHRRPATGKGLRPCLVPIPISPSGRGGKSRPGHPAPEGRRAAGARPDGWAPWSGNRVRPEAEQPRLCLGREGVKGTVHHLASSNAVVVCLNFVCLVCFYIFLVPQCP